MPEAAPATAPETTPDPKPVEAVEDGFSADVLIKVRGNTADRLKYLFVNRDVSYVESILLLEAVRDSILLEALNKIPREKIRDLVDLKKLDAALGAIKFAPAGGDPQD